MRTFSAPADLELHGTICLAFINNLQSDRLVPILEKHGLDHIDPTAWYSANEFMQTLNDLVKVGDFSSSFTAIGMEVGRIVDMPLQTSNPTLEDALHAWDLAYKGSHRNHHDSIGSVEVEVVNKKHYKTIHTHLYPDDFSYGIMYGFAKRFLPAGTEFSIYYDPNLPQRDHDLAPSTVIHIDWE